MIFNSPFHPCRSLVESTLTAATRSPSRACLTSARVTRTSWESSSGNLISIYIIIETPGKKINAPVAFFRFKQSLHLGNTDFTSSDIEKVIESAME